MFSKRQAKLDTIVGPESIIKGDISSKGTVKVDGIVEGNVCADCLIIGEAGHLTGDITVREIVVGGKVIGNIHAADGVDIHRKGGVCGDIFATRLTIAEGGLFDGRSTMQLQKKIAYSGDDTAVSEA
ncbi:MAG: bactofilin family protein [Desulfuromonadaceae bacterium]